jgi:hypothetical protein
VVKISGQEKPANVSIHMLIVARMKKIGYGCVSTEDQTVALQFDALRSAGWVEFEGRIHMVQGHLDRLVAVAALAAVMGSCLTPLSEADAEGTTDAAAKKKVEQFLGAGLPGKATVHFVDLNGDGVPEALVISNDQQDCGTRGCAANVLDLRGPTAKDIGDFIAFDLQPLSSRTRGWRDISMFGSGNSKRVVRFNGRVYQ